MRLALTLSLPFAFVGVTQAQIPLHHFQPPEEAGLYTRAAAFAGDVDADGITDVIVGDPYADPVGRATVRSGRNGALLHTFLGNHPNSELGRAVAGAGDVDGDGFDDVVVGGPFERNKGIWTGAARVYSGATGAQLHKFKGPKYGSLTGFAVAGLDVDLDGYSDIAVGSPGESCVDVYSGLTGALLWHAEKHASEFGSLLSLAGDVDADGVEDLLVAQGTIWFNGGYSGKAYVYSGRTGAELHKFVTAIDDDWFAFAVSSAGDVDGDGHADVAVGARGHDSAFPTVGRVDVYSGKTGALLLQIEGTQASEEFGTAVAPAGDFDQDGVGDLLITSKRAGGTGVYSGVDGSQLRAVDPIYGTTYWVADMGGDLDGDGRGDILLADANAPGGAWTYLDRDRLGASSCDAVANSTGIPASLYAEGSDQVTVNDFRIRGAHLPPGRFSYLLASLTPGFVQGPGGSQGDLCLGGQIARWSSEPRAADGGGATLQVLDLTSIPSTPPQRVVPGQTWYFQVWYRDVNPTPTSNFTRAISVTFQ